MARGSNPILYPDMYQFFLDDQLQTSQRLSIRRIFPCNMYTHIRMHAHILLAFSWSSMYTLIRMHAHILLAFSRTAIPMINLLQANTT